MWQDKTLFENRPIIKNEPIKVRAGFRNSTGTYNVPTGLFYLQAFDLSEDTLKIDVQGVDSWGYYGDMPIGTISAGDYNISELVRTLCDNVGISRDNQFISNVNNSYKQIEVYNNKEQEKPRNNGGFGDTYRNINLEFIDDRLQIISMSQTTSGSHRLLLCGINTIELLGAYEQSGAIFNRITDHNFTTSYQSESQIPFTLTQEAPYYYSFNQCSLQDYSAEDLITYQFSKFISGDTGAEGTYNNAYVYSCKKEGWYFNAIGSYLLPFDINNNSYGCYFDSDTGTGYITNKQSGTQKLYRYNMSNGSNTQTNSMVFAGTTDIGTIEVDAMFEMPRPYDTYLGTNLKYICIYGREGTGTQTYMYRYNMTGGTLLTLIDRGTLSNDWQQGTTIGLYGTTYTNGTTLKSGGWIKDNNIYEVIGHRTNSSFRQESAISLGKGSDIFRLGHFGFTYQHNTISNVGSVYLNTIKYPTGSYVNNTDRTQFYFNNLHSESDFFTASYTIAGMRVGIGETTGDKFKETIEKLSIPANYYAWFDGNGNFFFKSRAGYFDRINLSDSIKREHTNELNENIITASISKDVNKVKNRIIVKGTGATGTNIYQDDESMDIYGTRELSYENTYIQTQADSGTLGQMLVENLRNANYEVTTTIPFHPEIELVDRVNFNDSVNKINVPTATIKGVTHNLENWTTEIKAVNVPSKKTGV